MDGNVTRGSWIRNSFCGRGIISKPWMLVNRMIVLVLCFKIGSMIDGQISNCHSIGPVEGIRCGSSDSVFLYILGEC